MNSDGTHDYFDQDAPLYQDETLERRALRPPSPEVLPNFPPTKSKQDPSTEALGFGPISNPSSRSNSAGSGATLSQERIDHRGGMPEAGVTALAEGGSHDGSARASSSNDLRETAAKAIQVGANTPPLDIKLAERPVHRVDSAQDSSESVPQLPPDDPQRSDRASPLKLETARTTAVAPAQAEDSIAKSPTLSKHMIQVGEKVANSRPPIQTTSPTTDTSASSPRKASLPPFRHLAGLV